MPFLLFSCARFIPYDVNDDEIFSVGKLSAFDGIYELKADRNLNAAKNLVHLADYQANANLHYAITERTDTLQDKTIQVEIKSYDEKYLSFTFRNKKMEKDFFVAKGKLKKDGFFYLENSIFECIGLPYLLGGCYNCKTRLSIAQDQGLVMQKAIFNKGAILLFFVTGNSYNIVIHFNRVQQLSL